MATNNRGNDQAKFKEYKKELAALRKDLNKKIDKIEDLGDEIKAIKLQIKAFEVRLKKLDIKLTLK